MEYFYKNQVQAYIALWEYPESFSTNSNKVDWKKRLQVSQGWKFRVQKNWSFRIH